MLKESSRCRAIDAPIAIADGGGFKDWFIEEYNRPGFTVEIGKGKNPLPAETAEEIRQEHRKLLSWSELYEDASMEEKKVIASNLIKAVFLSENYGISIELNIAEEQYREGLVLG